MAQPLAPAHSIAATVAKMSRTEAQILAHYSAGETVIQIAAATNTSKDDIDYTIDALAGGNRRRARDLALEWQTRAKAVAAARGDTSPALSPASSVTKAAQDTGADLIADVLNRASTSEVPRLVRAAKKISDLIDQLGRQLAVHQQEQALRDEAAKLEARIAEIKRELSPKRQAAPRPATTGMPVDAKAVRAWAAANGVACPATGRIPAAVLTAHQQGS